MTLKLRTCVFFAIGAGLLLGLSQPLYIPGLIDVTRAQDYLGLLAFVGYVPLFLALVGQNLKRVFLLALLAITVQYTIVLYWIYIALHVHGHIAPIFASVITLALPLLMALKGATFFTIAAFLAQRYRISFLWIAPIALCAYEYFRNFYVFGGFPWGNVGYSLGRLAEIGQIASVVGVYGLAFFAGLVNALICIAIEKRSRASFLYSGSALTVVAAIYIFGVIRLDGADNEFAAPLRVALLQGNISQEVKSSGGLHASAILDIYLDLALKAEHAGAQLIVWPESAYPRMIDKDRERFDFNLDAHTPSVIGAVTFGDNPDGSYYVHNSAFITDKQGAVIHRYDKSHLVPFGEYVPWPMSGVVDRIVPGLGAFRPGTSFVPTRVELSDGKAISIGTTICYEGIFPEISRAYALADADLLVNLTNDAWYGFSSAPFQHLLMYRLRSIESGLPFVRATNTGISGWVDVYGREHQTTKLFERDLVIADVPLLTKKTIYTRVGDVLPICVCCC